MKNSDHDFTMPPFPGFPSVSRYVPVGPVLDTVERIARSVEAREAISLVIGPPGTGKSLACGLIAKRFLESHDVVVLGETTICDESAFQRFLLHRLGVALETNRPHDMDVMLSERLTGTNANPNGLVLIVDEAASLSIEVLEAIRRATNIMRDGQPMVSAVVVGGLKLEETLTAPSLESFVQRVTARCYLHPLTADETAEYIRKSIEACDASADDTISEAAIRAIHHATSGVARLVNQMMTEAIDCAAEMGETLITDATVNRAWCSLQQLPGPMIDEPEIRENSVVEFGELEPSDIAIPENMSMQMEIQAPNLGMHDPGMIEEDALDLMAEPESEEEGPSSESEEILTPDPVTLFGEFDSEEEVTVLPESSADEASQPAPVDIESVLHSEIVSLSQFATTNTELLEMQRPVDAVAEEVVEVVDRVVPNDREAPRDPSPNVLWYDEPKVDAEPKQSDDSDMLWITEDVDIDRRSADVSPNASRRIDNPGAHESPKLHVDYRELLEKMRKG